MKNFVLILAFITCVAPVFSQGGKSDIAAAKPRGQAIANAATILTRRETLSDEVPSNIKNPFNPGVDESEKSKTVRAVHTEKEMIAILAAQILSTGSAERDGQRFLLLGQRKVKVGDRVPIAFENAQYEVEIAAIDSGTFTIRYRDQEFTRPIKPGKNQ